MPFCSGLMHLMWWPCLSVLCPDSSWTLGWQEQAPGRCWRSDLWPQCLCLTPELLA